MDTGAPDHPPLFRPSKKRKIYRQRASSPPPSITNPATEVPSTAPLSQPLTGEGNEEEDDTAPSTAAIRRLLAARRHRGLGVEFRADSPRGAAGDHAEGEGEGAIVVRRERLDDGHEDGEGAGGLALGGKRFVTQTGMSAEGVDRHMMAYIDSELAKRHQPAGTSTASTSISAAPAAEGDSATTSGQRHTQQGDRPYQTASRGKLMEIELPPSLPPTTAPAAGTTRKPRERGKKKRTEEDIRRDALVEAVMRENGLGIYEPPPSGGDAVGDGEGDEEIAERFRREF
ncbi:hypothetical protein V490_03636, partial [Pseudogymnoascus sp. VKM F-3557]